ncbi:MAG TPA: KTSC domain-containing protein [Rhizomicrobium sp.]|nr:KTSC domain-containing protein [Rhizomicrobium sp.]
MNPLPRTRKPAPPILPKIARRPVVSSMMLSAGYDESHAVLEIEFVTGHVYRYHAVPRRDWQGLMDAESKGRYFDAYIRDKYPTMRVAGL